jgi:hypothetical protein
MWQGYSENQLRAVRNIYQAGSRGREDGPRGYSPAPSWDTFDLS